jgi:hypothetical protein
MFGLFKKKPHPVELFRALMSSVMLDRSTVVHPGWDSFAVRVEKLTLKRLASVGLKPSMKQRRHLSMSAQVLGLQQSMNAALMDRLVDTAKKTQNLDQTVCGELGRRLMGYGLPFRAFGDEMGIDESAERPFHEAIEVIFRNMTIIRAATADVEKAMECSPGRTPSASTTAVQQPFPPSLVPAKSNAAEAQFNSIKTNTEALPGACSITEKLAEASAEALPTARSIEEKLAAFREKRKRIAAEQTRRLAGAESITQNTARVSGSDTSQARCPCCNLLLDGAPVQSEFLCPRCDTSFLRAH